MREIVEVALSRPAWRQPRRSTATFSQSSPTQSGPKLLVHARGFEPADGPPNEDHFVLSVSDIDRSYEELRARFAFLVEPRDYSWGALCISPCSRRPPGRAQRG